MGIPEFLGFRKDFYLDELLRSKNAHCVGIDSEGFEDGGGQLFLMSGQIQLGFDTIQLLPDEIRMAASAGFLFGDQVQLGQAKQRLLVPARNSLNQDRFKERGRERSLAGFICNSGISDGLMDELMDE